MSFKIPAGPKHGCKNIKIILSGYKMEIKAMTVFFFRHDEYVKEDVCHALCVRSDHLPSKSGM